MCTMRRIFFPVAAATLLAGSCLWAQPGTPTEQDRQELMQQLMERERIAESERAVEGVPQSYDAGLMKAKEADRAAMMKSEERDVDEEYPGWGWYR